jgi:hypothetical protein
MQASAALQAEINRVLDFVKANPDAKVSQLDAQAERLTQFLKAEKVIPGEICAAYVEWQGALEFDLIAFCYIEGDVSDPSQEAKDRRFNLNRDGTIVAF